MPKRFLAGAGVLVLAACGGGGDNWTGTVRDSAGIAIVENPATGIWSGDDAPSITRELDIGTAVGPPETQFGNIAGITTDSNGRIYILDQQAKKVRVFEAGGTFVREMGGEGTGPGELSQLAAGLLRVAGDTIIVPDIMQQRVNRYAPDGSTAGSFPMMMTDGVPVRWDVTPDYRMVHQVRRMNFGPAAPGAADQPAMGTVGDPILVRGLDGSIQDTLAMLPPGKTISGSGAQMRMRLFDSEPVWDLGPEGRLYTALNDDYRVQVWSQDGKLERIITLPYQRRPITETDKTQIRDALREMLKTAGAPPANIEAALAMFGFADYFPAFSTLLAAPASQVWVQRVRTAEDIAAAGGTFEITDLGAKEWDAFDARGRYLGVVEMPARFVAMHVDGDHIYGVWKDDLDVQHVLRLKVQLPAV